MLHEIVAVVQSLPDLRAELIDLIGQIEPGQAASYGQLAAALGDKAAARWVGHAVRRLPDDGQLHLHRITQASGVPGRHLSANFAGTLAMLAAEGVPLVNSRVDLAHCAASFSGPAPLARLRHIQLAFEPTIFEQLGEPPRSVAGIDVSYRGDIAFACYARFDSPLEDQPSYSHVHQHRVSFPYISGYLSFRELPPLVGLLDDVRQQGQLADVILVDGSGILHPRRSGVAAMIGAVADVSTIGVTKKLLAGKFDRKLVQRGQVQPVFLEGAILGHVLQPRSGMARPLYVSPGHQMSVAGATAIVQSWLGNRRVPTPIHWADRISRQASVRG